MLSSLLGGEKKTVGLDLASHTLKVAVVDHSSDRPSLERVAHRHLDEDAIVDGEIMDPGLVTDAVRRLFRETGIEGRKIVFSVGGRDVIVKRIEMDRMPRDEAEEALRWEASQHIPFDLEEVQIDFVITDPEGEGLTMDVLLVAAKRDLVEEHVSLLRDSDLDPEIVDVEAFALYNALEANHPEALRGTGGVAHIGHDRTTVMIVRDGPPVLVRDLAFGTRQLGVELQRQLGLDKEDTEAVLRGEWQEADEELEEVVRRESQDVARGIEQGAAFLESESYGLALDQLYLCGEGVYVPGLLETIRERLDVPCEVPDPFGALAGAAARAGDPEAEKGPAAYMLPVGLALREVA